MIRFKECVYFCVVLSLQPQLVYSQWHRNSKSEPVFYVPSAAPPEYTRAVKGCSCKEISGTPLPAEVPFVPPPQAFHGPPPVPFGVPPPPLYEGQHQAAAASAAHPNQPVIIINNGDYGSKKDGGGLFGDDGGLLTLLFASHLHHGLGHGHGHHGFGPQEPLPVADNDRTPGNNGPLNINITIVMPKSDKSDDVKNKNEDE